MKQDIHFQYNLFRIPSVEIKSTKQKKKVIVGLIDASGSMGTYWAAMAKFWNQSIAESAELLITFSHQAKIQNSTYLDEDLKKHGGGMTNIYAAFEKLEARLILLPEDASITIVFISDGQDTVNGDKLKPKMQELKGGMGRDITMLCLGIQSGFPTKISMDIRELYHTGDQKIPALYLIEYASQKAFFNKFQTMSNCFKTTNSIKSPNSSKYLKQYPWQKDGEVDLKENGWVLASRETKAIELIYNETQKYDYEPGTVETLPLEDIVDCFRGWVQKVQLLSMDNEKMKETSKIAELTVLAIQQYTRQYQKIHSLYILSDKPLDQKQSFKDRANSLAVKNVGVRIKWYIDELQIIAKGVGIGQLNQYQAAKRIAIGTITGKYHQKALALKGITLKDFQIIKDQFAEIFKKTKLSEKASNQEVSIFTLQNQKEVFEEVDFLQGLKMCKSQFDLVQTFPIVGSALKVKRYDGSMINPWKVRVEQLAKTHKTIDSMYLANNNNKYELSVGKEQTESINAVLPIFGLEDQEMSPLFNTKLFKLAVSFMVVQNIDTYHEQAYLALLASTFVFLLKEPDTEWRKNLFQDIYTSIKVTYGKTPEFTSLIEETCCNPFVLFTAKEKEDHIDITKVLLIVFYIFKQQLLNEEKIKHLIELAIVHYTEKTYVENQFKMGKVANIQIKVKEDEDMFQDIDHEDQKLTNFNKIKNQEELKKLVDAVIHQAIDPNCIEVQLNQKIFLHQDQEKRVTFTHIKNYYQLLQQKKFEKGDFFYYFGHYLKGKTQANYNQPIKRDIQDVKKQIIKDVNLKLVGPTQGKKVQLIKKKLLEKYLKHFSEAHFGIVPLKKAELIDLCIQNKINFGELVFNQQTGMIKNACMSKNCSYFLKPMKGPQFQEHMRLWRKHLPARFHLIVTHALKEKKSPEEICESLFKSGVINIEKHEKNKEFVLNYIVQIKESLKE